MCRACWETPDDQGRRCLRSDGFSHVEGSQRNRVRGLNNAAASLAGGDPQGAVTQIDNARRAQHDLDCPRGDTVEQLTPVNGPSRDIPVASDDLDSLEGRMEQINRERGDAGLPLLRTQVVTEARPDESDPVMVWERGTARISGGSQDDLDALRFDGVHTEAAKFARTDQVLAATFAVTRIDSDGQFIPRSQGGADSTPARVLQYVEDAPDGELRCRYAPTPADMAQVQPLRRWAAKIQPTNDYLHAMQETVADDSLGPRDIGTAASAVAGFRRAAAEQSAYVAQQREAAMKVAAESDRLRAEAAARQAAVMEPSAGGAVASPTNPRMAASQSRWMGRPGDPLMAAARIEAIIPVGDDGRGVQRVRYVLRTQSGDVLSWLPSVPRRYQVGQALNLWGTVKGHTVFGGERQTEIFRCKSGLGYMAEDSEEFVARLRAEGKA